jgi:hypothetical protein
MKKRGIWGCDGRYNREQWKCIDSFDAIWRAGCSRGGGGGGWGSMLLFWCCRCSSSRFVVFVRLMELRESLPFECCVCVRATNQTRKVFKQQYMRGVCKALLGCAWIFNTGVWLLNVLGGKCCTSQVCQLSRLKNLSKSGEN